MKLSKLLMAICISAIFTLGIFGLHLSAPSVINNFSADSNRISDAFAKDMYAYHQTNPEFARRIVTSSLIETVHVVCGLDYAYSFVWVNFSLLFLCGIILYYLARSFSLSHRTSLLTVALFYTSFTILFAFFADIFSYDDPLQYVCIFLTMLALSHRQWFFASCAWFVAVFARETSVLLIPGLLLLFWSSHITQELPLRKKIIYFALTFGVPIAMYVGLIYMYLSHINFLEMSSQYFQNERWSHVAFNFGSLQQSSETIISLFLASGIIVYALYHYIVSGLSTAFDKKVLLAFLITSAINIPLVLLGARAREVRLFAFPLVFMWPFAGWYVSRVLKVFPFKEYVESWRKREHLISNTIFLVFGLVLIGVAYLFSWYVYQPISSAGIYFQMYIFVLLVFVIIYELITFQVRSDV